MPKTAAISLSRLLPAALLAALAVFATAPASPAQPDAPPAASGPAPGPMGGPMGAGGPMPGGPNGPMAGPGSGVAPPLAVETTTLAKTGALRTISLPGAARPEIVAAGGKVYVLYLDPASRAFMAAAYDADLKTAIAPPRRLIVEDPVYGHPTDIRIATDGKSLFAFYEKANDQQGTASLWGVRLALDPSFRELSGHAGPIAVAPFHYRAQAGEELLDDPAPLVAPGAVYVATRLKDALTPGGRAAIRVRELTPDLATVRRTFDIDLSGALSGGARTFALLADRDGFPMLAVPTATGTGFAPIDLAVPSDLLLVSLDGSWRIRKHRVLAPGQGNTLLSPMGLARSGPDLLVAYREIVHTPAPLAEARSVVALFGPDLRQRARLVLDATPMGMPRPRIPRPVVAAGNGRIYVGGETQLGAYLSVYSQLR